MPSRAVFFQRPHHGGPVHLHPVASTDKGCQVPRVELWILFMLFHSELQHLTFELARTPAPGLSRQQGAEAPRAKGVSTLVKTLAAEAELSAGLGDAQALGLLRAQHLVLDLGAIVSVEEAGVGDEQLLLDSLRVWIQGAGGGQCFFLVGRQHHGDIVHDGASECQYIYAHNNRNTPQEGILASINRI